MSRVDTQNNAGRLMGPLFVWLAVVGVGAGVAGFSGLSWDTVLPLAIAGAVPALMSLLLAPMANRLWAQILLLLVWTGFAVFACFAAGLIPMAITFLTVPAIAMLFNRERVVEALVVAAMALVACAFVLGRFDIVPQGLSGRGLDLFIITGIGGTVALIISAMIAGAPSARSTVAPLPDGTGTTTRWRDGVGGGLFEFDSTGRLLAANAQGRAQFGLHDTSTPIMLETLSDRPSDGALIKGTALAARRQRGPAEARLSLGPNTADGASMDLRFTPTKAGGWMLHTIDRTDEEARLESLRRSNTVASREAQDKTLFFAGVSHELRTPLNAIIGFSDMMRSRLFGPLPGKYAEYADLIHDSGQYMLDLIGDVLDLSKVEAGRYSLNYDTFDATDVVRSSVKMIRPAADAGELRIVTDIPGDDPLLLTADRKAVRQILLNLLSNAVKFSPKGAPVALAALIEDDQLTLRVSDKGAGMSAEDVARIGEPFAQGSSAQASDVRGSGLGLSLVKTLTELHGGTFTVQSALGEGTQATVLLPVSPPE